MGLIQRLRHLIRRPVSASTVGLRRPTSARHDDTIHEDAVRATLHENPNDARAFAALAEIVRRHAAESASAVDPLSAEVDDDATRRAADLAVWSLAEELAGNPRAWFPLIELARLSIVDDREGAMRRLATAAERDPSGAALAEGLAVLRGADLPVEALGLGVGHWRVREHDVIVGRHLALAALEAERPAEARHHLDSMRLHPDHAAVEAVRAEIEPMIDGAERRATT
ncbi:hypothetical protein [Actinotalea sp.]|uniref:hypothetical protein n=1 Tax=Actinotalea sp. TaxID=1872145 RepID=UPI00356A46CC